MVQVRSHVDFGVIKEGLVIDCFLAKCKQTRLPFVWSTVFEVTEGCDSLYIFFMLQAGA